MLTSVVSTGSNALSWGHQREHYYHFEPFEERYIFQKSENNRPLSKMTGFLQKFHSLPTLSDRSASAVATSAARKAIELAMLGLCSESLAILSLLMHYSDITGAPLSSDIPAEVQFIYEAANEAPTLVERMDEERLKKMERELRKRLPHLPKGVDLINGGEKDFTTVTGWLEELEMEGKGLAGSLDATTGYLV